MLRAQPVHELAGREERLAAGAVEPLVVALVDVARRGARAPEALDARPVPRIDARADEVVVRERERVAQRGEPLRLRVHELRDGQTGLGGGLHVLQRVVVGAAEKPDVLAAQATVAGENVRLHAFEREPDVRVAVHVRDRGGDVEASRRSSVPPFWPLGADHR